MFAIEIIQEPSAD